ncbi:hypothetical protein AgCh_001766 [Apium graveolens]
MIESAVAFFDKDTPDRWFKVACMIPGKNVSDVIKKYRELEVDVSDIEAGLIPVTSYTSDSFTLDWMNHQSSNGMKQIHVTDGKRSTLTRLYDQGKKKKRTQAYALRKHQKERNLKKVLVMRFLVSILGNYWLMQQRASMCFRFELRESSMIELEDMVIERLKLKRHTFNIKYQEDEGDWVLIACRSF